MTTKKNKKTVLIVVVCILIIAAVIGGFFAYDKLFGKSQYPLEYKDLIVEYAQKYDLDPYFVAAIIHTESGYDKDAVSSAGAVGLMQIMPETADWIAGKLDIENFDVQTMRDPQTNIEFGCWYLNFLKEKFDENLPVMMAAYNAGHNRVQDWLENPQYSDGKNLTDIPIEAADNYVKKVTKAYDKYKEYYEIG
ncbi:MAG: lytic transglycosylase domain-containing protein [Christensenellaceae bacterium]